MHFEKLVQKLCNFEYLSYYIGLALDDQFDANEVENDLKPWILRWHPLTSFSIFFLIFQKLYTSNDSMLKFVAAILEGDHIFFKSLVTFPHLIMRNRERLESLIKSSYIFFGFHATTLSNSWPPSWKSYFLKLERLLFTNLILWNNEKLSRVW